MPIKDVWISGNEAAEIISRNSGHIVLPAYVRILAAQGKITSRAKNGREKEYLRRDVEAIKVEGKGKNRDRSSGPTEREKRAAKKRVEESAA